MLKALIEAAEQNLIYQLNLQLKKIYVRICFWLKINFMMWFIFTSLRICDLNAPERDETAIPPPQLHFSICCVERKSWNHFSVIKETLLRVWSQSLFLKRSVYLFIYINTFFPRTFNMEIYNATFVIFMSLHSIL